MIHYYGNPLNETCMDLAEEARKALPSHNLKTWLHLVPFFDHRLNKQRFMKFEWLAGQWVFTDIIDK